MSLILAIALLCFAVYGAGALGARSLRRVGVNGNNATVRQAAGQVRQRGRKARSMTTAKAKQAVQATPSAGQIWHGVIAANWLEKRQARRAANPDSVLPWRERLRRRRTQQPPASPPGQPAQSPNHPYPPHYPPSPAWPEPATPQPAPQAPPVSQPHTPSPPPANGAPTNGKAHPPMTTTSTTTPGTSGDLFTAVRQLLGQSLAGGMQSKRRGIHSLAEGFTYFASELTAFAKALSEPGQGYPSAIWEPIGQAAAHCTAAASKMGESDSKLASLANTPLGEVAGSPVKAPHQEQLNHE